MDQQKNAVTSNEIFSHKRILALSWNIATEPKLYRELAPNPYAPATIQLILKRFPKENIIDIIRAVVLAEPEGKYDRNFRMLGVVQQAKELRKQNEISTRINKRLIQYWNKYATKFSELPKDFVYDSLSRVVFETNDLKEIEQFYAQNQRRYFRLAIVNFIESTSRIKNSPKKLYQKRLVKVTFAVSVLLLFSSLTQNYVRNTTHHPQTKRQILGIETSQGFPVRLKIPAINVDTAIIYVGVTAEGAMEVPNDTFDVGWFGLGPRPGDKGNAVIAGHVDGRNGDIGVFADLNKLKKGDKVYVEYGRGTSFVFVVSKKRLYDPGHAEDVFRKDDIPHLNLITCDGVWNIIKKSYSKRLVVFTDIMH